MCHMKFVAIGNSSNQLAKDIPRFVFPDSILVFLNVFVEITAFSQLQNKIQFGLCVDNLVKPNYARVLDKFHTSYFLKQVVSRHLVQPQFVNHFHRYPLTSEHMAGKFHHSKMSTPKSFLQVVHASDLAIHDVFQMYPSFASGSELWRITTTQKQSRKLKENLPRQAHAQAPNGKTNVARALSSLAFAGFGELLSRSAKQVKLHAWWTACARQSVDHRRTRIGRTGLNTCTVQGPQCSAHV